MAKIRTEQTIETIRLLKERRHTRKEIADRLGCSERTIYNAEKFGTTEVKKWKSHKDTTIARNEN